MDPRVAEILAKKQEADRLKKEKEKEDLLLAQNLYDKVYAPDGECSDDYPYFDWDDENNEHLYYKKVPIKVTDEEFEALKSCTENYDNEESSNPVAITLAVIAWIIYISGFLACVILCSEDYVATGFYLLSACFLSGSVFLAIAEIIKLLFKINKKLDTTTIGRTSNSDQNAD